MQGTVESIFSHNSVKRVKITDQMLLFLLSDLQLFIILWWSSSLKLGLIKSNSSAKAAWSQLAVRGGELGGEHHIAVRIDGADLSEAAGLDGHAVGQLAAAVVEGQQADTVAVRGADESSVRAEAQLFDVAPAHVGLLDVVGEAEGAAGRDEWAGWRPLLELIHTRPLKGEKVRVLC